MSYDKALRAAMRNPNAFIALHTTGKLPVGRAAKDTPLMEAIRRIPRRDWQHFVGVKVDGKLGFNGSRTFRTLEQAAAWLGNGKTLYLNETMPYQSWLDRKVKKVSLKVIIDNCASVPQIYKS